MLTAALLGLALLADVPVAAVAVGAVAATQPTLLLGAAATWALHQARRRRRIRTRPDDEAAFLRALSSEVRSGASLRVALADAALRVPEIPVGAAVRLGRAGAPMTEVAPRLEAALPVNGRLTAAAFRIASDSGARTADLFEDLALQAAETAALERERQTTTAQARLSAGVVAVAPVLFGGLVFLARGPAIAGGGPWAVAVAVAGLALELLGIAVVVVMLRGQTS